MNEQVKKMWDDPRFQIYADVLKLLESGKVWAGMDWSYSQILPVQYLPVRDKVRQALDDLKKEYGVGE